MLPILESPYNINHPQKVHFLPFISALALLGLGLRSCCFRDYSAYRTRARQPRTTIPGVPREGAGRGGAGPGTATRASVEAGRSGGAELRWRKRSSRMWRSWGEGVGGRWIRWRRGPPPPSPTPGGGRHEADHRSCSATPAVARVEVWRSPRTWRP